MNHSEQKNNWLQIVKDHVEATSHGSVQIAVYDSKIVQLDTTKKWRLPPSQGSNKPVKRR